MIHKDGECADGIMSELLCSNVAADDIYEDIQEVYNAIGETIGRNDVARVFVYEKGHPDEPDAAGQHDHNIGGGIELRHDWQKHPGVVHHEAGHEFFENHLGGRSCAGAGCVRSVVEHWGADEGVAMVISGSRRWEVRRVAGRRYGRGNHGGVQH